MRFLQIEWASPHPVSSNNLFSSQKERQEALRFHHKTTGLLFFKENGPFFFLSFQNKR